MTEKQAPSGDFCTTQRSEVREHAKQMRADRSGFALEVCFSFSLLDLFDELNQDRLQDSSKIVGEFKHKDAEQRTFAFSGLTLPALSALPYTSLPSGVHCTLRCTTKNRMSTERKNMIANQAFNVRIETDHELVARMLITNRMGSA